MTKNSTVTDTREGKRAHQLKAEMMDLLGDVVDVMERGRAEGFDITFTIPRNETGANIITLELIKVTKSW
jgi:hypothetical protein